MLIRFGFEISVSCPQPTPMLLALSPHPSFAGRLIGDDRIRTTRNVGLREYRDRFDNRITRLTAPPGDMRLWCDCVAEVDGAPDPVVPDARQHAIDDLPDEALAYLVPSRYCESDRLGDFAWAQFGAAPAGWARVQAIVDYVHAETTFGYEFGRPTKTAHDVFAEKTGVCRDFAHLSIALCRAMNIPARYASGYLGDIGVEPSDAPGDFCAWFEAYLDGAWRTFDARYNTPRMGRVLMVRGCDAADVAMVTSFGAYDLAKFKVWTEEVDPALDDAGALALLDTPFPGPALVEPSSARFV